MNKTATGYIALIPAYEPDSKMTDVIEELAEIGFDIVVVDDGSGDEYSSIFEQVSERATVLTHQTNRGKGAALKTGLTYINKYRITSPQTVVVTVDADGQHLAADAMRIARHAAAEPGSLVLGSRTLMEDVPLRSKVGNTITRHVYKLATGTPVHDTQTGLRAFTQDLIPALLEIRGERYEYEINVLLEFARRGVPITEEEIETVYLDGNSRSHFSTVKDSFRVYREILKFSASSFIGFMVDYGMYALLLALTAAISLGSTPAAAVCMAYGLVIANIGARLVSAAVNYTINRKLVFGSTAKVGRSVLQYAALAAFILAGNTIVLSTLVGNLGMNSYAAKVVTELIFFAVSWLAQKYVIFGSVQESAGTARVRARRPARLKSAARSTAVAGEGNHHRK